MSEAIHPTGTKKLTKRQIIIRLGLILTAALGLTYASEWYAPIFFENQVPADDSTTQLNPLPVNVTEIKFVDSIEQSRNFTGTIRARHRSDLGFEIPGKIKAIHFDEGDAVEEGQILAELNHETFDAQKDAILAQITQAESVLAELNAGPRIEAIRVVRANVEEAQSIHENATLVLNRQTKLRKSNAISSAEYDQAVYAAKATLAALNAAKERLSELEAGTRHEKINAQQSALRQLAASLKEIDVAISKSNLIAPFSGTVTRRYLDPGSIAQASSPIIRLVQRQHLEAWIGLPVSIATEVELEKHYDIVIDNEHYQAKASAKIQELDPATRTQTVLFELSEYASQKVVSGQLCEIEFSSTVNSSGFWIPTAALTRGVRGLWSVMVLDSKESGTGYVTEKRDIEIVKTESNRVLARGTIQTGDQVVVDGVHRIAEGQWVTTTNGRAQPTSPASSQHDRGEKVN